MWNTVHVRALIDKRKKSNSKFHDMSGSQKYLFWKSVATDINYEFGTFYLGTNCKDKFNALVKNYKNMSLYIQDDKFDQLRMKNLALGNLSAKSSTSSANSSTNANLPVENCQNSPARADSMIMNLMKVILIV
ncbi:8332_t:CDS:2 [Dentiscutata erythropus]|uniref:8332_t:CDS:1 n=1 Tax=Dentiscutata erythropus TaxID=1348616 RepID=A0A9N9NMU8_9GLOM|nr:8332_t:CDS:2 [Dentiscutata erythropus]